MMETLQLGPLYELQKDLDAEIAKNHGVTYDSTHQRRLLAFLVEVGEFANETRCFKYWSYKGPSPMEVMLEEYVDGLHFLLSLGIPLGVSSYEAKIETRKGNLTEALLDCYGLAYRLKDDYTLHSYYALVDEYLSILTLIGANGDSLVQAYKKKMEENHRRQATNY